MTNDKTIEQNPKEFKKIPSEEEFESNLKKLKRLQEINRTAQINHIANENYRSTKTTTNKEFENLWTKKELELETLQKQKRILTKKTTGYDEEIDKLDNKIEIAQEDLYSNLGPDIEKKARDIEMELDKNYRKNEDKARRRWERIKYHPLRTTLLKWKNEANAIEKVRRKREWGMIGRCRWKRKEIFELDRNERKIINFQDGKKLDKILKREDWLMSKINNCNQEIDF